MELRVKELLLQKGITLKEFSSMSGISQSNLSNYLNGNISPTLETLKKIALHLEVELVELFKAKDDLDLYVKVDGVYYPITKKDIIEIVLNKRK